MKKCLKCDKPADWIRVTQFAGEHPFCDQHAKDEKEFMDENSYKFWEKIEDK